MALFWVLHLGVFRSAQVAPVGILARHYGICYFKLFRTSQIRIRISRIVWQLIAASKLG